MGVGHCSRLRQKGSQLPLDREGLHVQIKILDSSNKILTGDREIDHALDNSVRGHDVGSALSEIWLHTSEQFHNLISYVSPF